MCVARTDRTHRYLLFDEYVVNIEEYCCKFETVHTLDSVPIMIETAIIFLNRIVHSDSNCASSPDTLSTFNVWSLWWRDPDFDNNIIVHSSFLPIQKTRNFYEEGKKIRNVIIYYFTVAIDLSDSTEGSSCVSVQNRWLLRPDRLQRLNHS